MDPKRSTESPIYFVHADTKLCFLTKIGIKIGDSVLCSPNEDFVTSKSLMVTKRRFLDG